MLRDFVYNPDKNLIIAALHAFDVAIPEESWGVALTRFEVITPDSFMWRIALTNDHIYYLYAEDFVDSLDHIKAVFHSYLQDDSWEFVSPRQIKTFDQSSPFLNAETYQKPSDAEEIMKYASESGFDHTLLVRSNETVGWALFADHAPRGFDQ